MVSTELVDYEHPHPTLRDLISNRVLGSISSSIMKQCSVLLACSLFAEGPVCVSNLHFGPFLLTFSPLPSFFGGDFLTQHESPVTGDLGFVVLNVYHDREEGKVDKYILLLCSFKLGLSACSCDKYLMR
jgi:hypothetical protein